VVQHARSGAAEPRRGGRPDATHRADGRDSPNAEIFADEGAAINSGSFNGMTSAQFKKEITDWLQKEGRGQRKINYKLRDWLFSRQRYWGEPFPILHGPDGEIRPVDEVDLPVELPELPDFRPTASDDPDAPPRPPLGRAPESWRSVVIDGVRYERELNTMPQWAGSCWYYLRFLDPDNGERFVDRDIERYWMLPESSAAVTPPSGHSRSAVGPAPGVDLYVGGAEHAVLHLLYARFWHKVLHDLGHVSTPEPFGRLFNQGYIQAHAYQDERGMYVDAPMSRSARAVTTSRASRSPACSARWARASRTR
jgi:leucyl-tRNA synthetase